MSGEDKPVIIVRRIKKVAGGAHGAAWKIAYADFVTAMMAFFMVMWLVSTVNKEQRAAIFEYFKNPSMEPGKAPKPAPGQAGIEAFFTAKGTDLFAILPRWPGRRFTVKEVTGIKSVTLLGANTPLKFTANASGVTVELPDLPEALLGQPAWTLRLSH